MTVISIDAKLDIRLAPFEQAHISSILALMNQEGWYYYDKKELGRYLELEESCFTLLHQEKVVGSIFTTNYGNQAWIGNVIVADETQAGFCYRNRGYAGKMIQHVMKVLSEKGVNTFRLGSVPTAIGAYKKVGFQAESFTTAQQASLPLDNRTSVPVLDKAISVESMTPQDLINDVVRIDETYFGSNRSALFHQLHQDSIQDSCLCLKDQGKIVGYIMIRRRSASKEEGQFAEGPDLVYRLGPSCVLPEYGVEGFKILLNEAIAPVNAEVRHSGMSAKIYVVFPQNGDKERIYADFEAMGGNHPEHVFNEHDHIFGDESLAKNDELWTHMQSMGFKQEYFEQTMSVTAGEASGLAPTERAGRHTLADTEGIFASATPGDKA